MCELLSGFIVFEGLDGSGKSTQARLLEARLKAERDVILTAEPTDNPVGQLVRKVLRHQVKTTSTALALLYAADRSDHLFNPEYGIRRQLDEGKTVISDRYFYSSLAYQGVTEDFDWLKKINSYPYSEYIIFIDTDASSCIQRIEGRVIVLAKRIPFPVIPEEETPQIRMSYELDAEKVISLPFIDVRPFPQIVYRGETCILSVGIGCRKHYVLSCGSILEMIYASETFLAPVHTGQTAEEVKAFLVPQPLGQSPECRDRHFEHTVTGFRPYGRRLNCIHSFFNVDSVLHIVCL